MRQRLAGSSRKDIKGDSPRQFADQIQGSLTKELVLGALKSLNSQDQRTEGFLRQWIEKASEQELENLIIAITGSSTLSPYEKLKTFFYNSEEKSLPIFHTCNNQVDLSTDYEDYAMFKTKLEQSLSCIDGFQSD